MYSNREVLLEEDNIIRSYLECEVVKIISSYSFIKAILDFFREFSVWFKCVTWDSSTGLYLHPSQIQKSDAEWLINKARLR